MLHFERMIDQEPRLKASRMTSTACAPAPVSRTRSMISPPTKTAEGRKKCMIFREAPELDYKTVFPQFLWTYPMSQSERCKALGGTGPCILKPVRKLYKSGTRWVLSQEDVCPIMAFYASIASKISTPKMIFVAQPFTAATMRSLEKSTM